MKRLLVLSLGLLLAACAQVPVAPSRPAPSTAAALSRFKALGKVAWSRDGKGDSARFAWNYDAPELHVDLLTPLGSTAATIDAEPGRALLRTENGQFSAETLEGLSQRVFAMELPLTGIEYWLQGLPVPGQPYTEEAIEGGKRLRQRGLVLDFRDWIEREGRPLPQQVDIRQGDLSLKLRIKEWTLP